MDFAKVVADLELEKAFQIVWAEFSSLCLTTFMVNPFLLTAIIVLSVTLYYRRTAMFKAGRIANQFPGEKPNWLIGNIAQIGKDEETLKYGLACTAKYPKAYRNWIAWWPLISVVHPSTVKAVLGKQIPKAFNYRFFDLWLGKQNIFTACGDQYKALHRLWSPFLQTDNLRKMVPEFVSTGETLCDKWLAAAKTSGNGVAKFDLWTQIPQAALDTAFKTAFSFETKCQTHSNPASDAIDAMNAIVWRRTMNPLLWNDWIYSKTADYQTTLSHVDSLVSIGADLVRERKKDIASGKVNNSDKLDLLSIALDAQRSIGDVFSNMSDEQIAVYVTQWTFGGYDTTATTLTWILYCLAKFEDWQIKAREEVLHEVGHETLTYDCLEKFVVLERVMKESMRYITPVPIVGRESDRDLTIDGKLTTRNTWFEVHIYATHHNPEVWENPMVFDPDRFLPQNIAKMADYAYSFIPFSAGPRICPGYKIAYAHMKAVAAMILQRFDISLSKDCPEVVLLPQAMMHSKTPLLIDIKPRK